MLSLSGVEVEQECFKVMERINKRTARAAIFHIKEEKLICVETLMEEAELKVQLKDSPETAEERSEKVFKQLSATLKEDAEKRGKNEPRYIFTNFVCEKKGRTIDKMVFIHFNPDDCGVREKMIYANHKGILKLMAKISLVDLHLSDYDEFDFGHLKPQFLSKAVSL